AASGPGTRTIQRNPGWWTGDLTLERREGAHSLALGLNANRYQTAQETLATANWRSAANPAFNSATYGKTSLWGVWAEDAITLGTGVTLTAGLRYDRWRAFAGGIGALSGGTRADARYPERSGQSISPKLSLQA